MNQFELVVHKGCKEEFPESLGIHFLSLAEKLKTGQTVTSFSKVHGTFYLTRGKGKDRRIFVSREKGQMPGIDMTGRGKRKDVVPSVGPSLMEKVGPGIWKYLEDLAESEIPNPEWQDKVSSVSKMLPCGECRNHFSQILKETPPPEEPELRFPWLILSVHNRVNRKLNRPEWTVEQAKNKRNKNLCQEEISIPPEKEQTLEVKSFSS